MLERFAPGALIDGFVIGECIHAGGNGFIYKRGAARGQRSGISGRIEGAGDRPRAAHDGHRQLRNGADDPAGAVGTARTALRRRRRPVRDAVHRDGMDRRANRCGGSSNARRCQRTVVRDRRGARGRGAQHSCAGRRASRLEAREFHPARQRRGGAAGLRLRTSRALSGPARGRAAFCGGVGAVCFAGTAARRPQRPAQRHLRAGRAALRTCDRRTAFRRSPPPMRGCATGCGATRAAPCSVDAGVPPWLQEVILRCLDPNAAERYQSAAHLAFDLRHPEPGGR